MQGDLPQILEVPLTPDGKIDVTTLNTILRMIQERFFALEGRTQPSQIRDSLEVLGDVRADGAVSADSLVLDGQPLAPVDPSLDPAIDPSITPAALLYTGTLGEQQDLLMNPLTFRAEDEFVGGGTTTGIIGILGWNLASGTVTQGTPNQGHPGYVTLTSGAGPAVARIQLQGLHAMDLRYLAMVLRTDVSDVSNTNYAFGFTTSNPAAGVEVATGVYFSYVAATSGFWRTYTNNAVTSVANTTDVAVAVDTWYLLEIVLDITADAQTADFYINRRRAFRHTTGIPTSSATPILIAQATTANPVSVSPTKFVATGRVPLSTKVWT